MSVYIGAEGKARKVRAAYVGKNGRAQKVRKAYTGIGGRAFLFMTALNISLFSKSADSGSKGDDSLLTAGAYALNAGGRYGIKSAAAWDSQLLKRTVPDLCEGRYGMGAACAEDRAFFAGGKTQSGVSAKIDTYDRNLSHASITMRQGMSFPIAVRAGSRAIIAGGSDASGRALTWAFVIDRDMTRTDIGPLSESSGSAGGRCASNGRYVFIKGSETGAFTVYDAETLVKVTPPPSEGAVSGGASASCGVYGIFAGGRTGGGLTDLVSAYDENMTETRLRLSSPREGMCGCTMGETALFWGGRGSSNNISAPDIFDSDLTLFTGGGECEKYGAMPVTQFGASVGSYAIFRGSAYTAQTGATAEGTVNLYIYKKFS